LTDSKQTLAKNIGALFVLQGANYVLPLITLPYLTRVLGPEKFGLIAFAQASVQYLVMLVDYGFNWSATKEIAAHRDDMVAVSAVTSAVYVVKMAFTLIAGGVLAAVVLTVPSLRAEGGVWFAAFGGVIGSLLFPVWFFQGLERMEYISILSISSRLLTTVAIFVIVTGPTDCALAALLLAVGPAIAGVFALGIMPLVFRVRFSIPSVADIRHTLVDGRDVFIATGAISLYTSGNALIVGIFTNNVAVGYYSGADRIVKAVLNLLTPVSQAIYPRIGALAAESRIRAINFIGKCLCWMTVVALLLSLLLYIAAKPLVMILLGSKYLPAVTLIHWMAPLPVLIVLSNMFGFQTMVNFGFQREFRQILLIVGLSNLVVITGLVITVGVSGAAIASLVAEISVTSLSWWALRRNGISLFRRSR
jgi:PST family polysaccharide transporter